MMSSTMPASERTVNAARLNPNTGETQLSSAFSN